MLKKLMIRAWSGPLPPWVESWRLNTAALKPYGWDFVIVNNLAPVIELARTRLNLNLTIPPGTRKAGDLDPILGWLLQDMIKTYDFWGHCALDAVYGRVDRFLTDQVLAELDVFGNDPQSINGAFSVYRNCPEVNRLFSRVGANGPVTDHRGLTFGGWRELLEDPEVTGWDEGAFSDVVAAAGARGEIRFDSAHYLSNHRQLPPAILSMDLEGRLLDSSSPGPARELMMYHFNTKTEAPRWPL
jgi:hypothetical protein